MPFASTLENQVFISVCLFCLSWLSSTMTIISTMMIILTMMTISPMMTIVFVRKLEAVHKKVGGCLISYNLQLACVMRAHCRVDCSKWWMVSYSVSPICRYRTALAAKNNITIWQWDNVIWERIKRAVNPFRRKVEKQHNNVTRKDQGPTRSRWHIFASLKTGRKLKFGTFCFFTLQTSGIDPYICMTGTEQQVEWRKSWIESGCPRQD